MNINRKNGVGRCPVSLLLLSYLVTERPDKERVQAMGLEFRGDEGEEFSKLLRIPHGRFIPPFLAAHQKAVAPQEFMSKLLAIYLEEGFKFEQSTGVRPDHVGVVLEFLALLESEKKNPPDELQVLIAVSLKQFAEALGKATEHPLYRKVADVLVDMVETETVASKQKQI
ncbi:MAG: molecular chaperone TorD family protein [Candidatus Aminicenantes bacterium]|nr:molecular chaperone TorD family protein [Candidatus Aminicenantes bacterium]